MSDKITWTNERRKLSQLIPWPRNPRQIKTDQAKRLVESFDEFGQVETIAIGPDNGVYNGHQRLNVLAQKYGQDYEVEVRVASRPLDEKEREKLTIFLHKGAAGEWDWDSLANNFEIPDLLDWGFSEKELQLGGFDLNEPAGDDPGAQMDKAEELREKWGVLSRQLWRLGEHRLICGDCTDRAVVEKVMGGEKAQLVITDPPYGVTYQDTGAGAWDENKKALKRAGLLVPRFDKIENDDLRGSDLFDFLISSFSIMATVCDPKAAWYVFHASKTQMIFEQALNAVDYIVRSQLIWYKSRPAFNFSQYKFQHEPMFYAFREGESPYWYGDKAQVTVWEINSVNVSDYLHPTTKPVPVIERAVSNSSKKNDIVYEPFSGSGTTLIACERLHRKCRAVEISPAYCGVAIQRWVDMTGGTPELLDSLH